MPDIDIDTTDAQYQQLLSGLGTLRTVLAPRIRILHELWDQGERQKVRQWLQRDPLLRRTLLLAQKLRHLLDQELDE